MPSPHPTSRPTFTPSIREAVADLLAWRRDVRSFRADPLPNGTVERLLAMASLSPSVGLSEPWRFVVVDDADRKAEIAANFAAANAAALAAQESSKQALYARLKLAGLASAPVQIAAFADHGDPQGHGLGRATMPATTDYSVAIAIHTLWLAARLEGIGLGWVSILDPAALVATLDVPADWRFIGYLCLGYPEAEDDRPALQRAGWDERRDPASRILFR